MRPLRRFAVRKAQTPPVVCFATGGSGTRAVAAVLEEAGVFLGPDQNRAKDALTMKPFLRKWPERYLADSGWVDATLTGQPRADLPDPRMMAELDEAITNGREGIPSPSARWGWKAPRTMLVFPAICARFPDLHVIHVVRDGRDMAYSRNQGQLDAVGHVVLAEEMSAMPRAVRSAAMWSRMNLAAARYGRRIIGDRHLVIRYEDLCGDPRRTVELTLRHAELELPDYLIDQAATSIRASDSVGRWRDQDPDEVEQVKAVTAEALAEFGYK